MVHAFYVFGDLNACINLCEQKGFNIQSKKVIICGNLLRYHALCKLSMFDYDKTACESDRKKWIKDAIKLT